MKTHLILTFNPLDVLSETFRHNLTVFDQHDQGKWWHAEYDFDNGFGCSIINERGIEIVLMYHDKFVEFKHAYKTTRVGTAKDRDQVLHLIAAGLVDHIHWEVN